MAKFELYVVDVVAEAMAQIGKNCGKTNEYSAELDAVKFYNYPKNGAADSCSIFVDDMIYRCIKPQTANNARAALYEPNKDNCAAGCTQAAQYFKDHGAWYSKMSDAHTGDKIFFKKSNGQIYHTGLVVDWDNKGIYTVEGNTNGGKVAKKFYAYGDSKVAGFGRPQYTAYKKEDENTQQSEQPVKPEPSQPEKSIDELAKEVINGKWGNGADRAKRLKAAGYDYDAIQARVNEMLGTAPKGKAYTVSVRTVLNVRTGAGTNFRIVKQLANGTKVTVSETKNGWGKIGTDQWVSMAYLK